MSAAAPWTPAPAGSIPADGYSSGIVARWDVTPRAWIEVWGYQAARRHGRSAPRWEPPHYTAELHTEDQLVRLESGSDLDFVAGRAARWAIALAPDGAR